MLNDSQIRQIVIGDTTKQGSATSRVDLDAKKIRFGVGGGNLRRGLAHAKTDLENSWGLAAEDLGEVEWVGLPRQAPRWHSGLPGLALAWCEVSTTVNETPDMRGRSAVRTDGRVPK
jgi:hypothetical protein